MEDFLNDILEEPLKISLKKFLEKKIYVGVYENH